MELKKRSIITICTYLVLDSKQLIEVVWERHWVLIWNSIQASALEVVSLDGGGQWSLLMQV